MDRGGLRTFASRGPARCDLDDPLPVGDVTVSVLSAVKAITAGDRLAIEHRRVLLDPYPAAGSASAATAPHEGLAPPPLAARSARKG